MKLKQFKHIDAYRFLLIFENSKTIEADLTNLIGHHIPLDAVITAHIDPEWGCLEFNDGSIDIEPKTLYRFATGGHFKEVA